MPRRTSTTKPPIEHTYIYADDTLLLQRGDSRRIKGLKGWFRFLYVDTYDNLVFYGPEGQHAQFRTFLPEQVGAAPREKKKRGN